MKWSKLKHLVEEKFASSIKDRISINSTRYGNCTCGHAWITLDKQIVANFCTRAFWNRSPSFNDEKGKFVPNEVPDRINPMYKKQYTDYGELSRQDAYQACWEFVHDISVEEAINSDDCLIQALAILDSRIGKRRLRKIEYKKLHPLASKLFIERLKAEKVPFNQSLKSDSSDAAAV